MSRRLLIVEVGRLQSSLGYSLPICRLAAGLRSLGRGCKSSRHYGHWSWSVLGSIMVFMGTVPQMLLNLS